MPKQVLESFSSISQETKNYTCLVSYRFSETPTKLSSLASKIVEQLLLRLLQRRDTSKKECVGGAELKSNDAAMKDAKITPEKEE